MWEYSFMWQALIAGLIIACVCGIVSVFVVLRRTAFAAHALGHMSLTGAAIAGIFGMSMISGELCLNIICAIIMGLMSEKIKKNDLSTGVILTFALGLGSYFLFLSQNNYAGSVISVLFGNILAISNSQIYTLIIVAVIVILTLIIIARPLLLASIDPVVANAKNIPIKTLTIIFFIILALTVSIACQIVGALLVFVMLIIPGAIGMQWGDGIYTIISISVLSATLTIIIALYIAYYLNLPVSFCITTILSIIYFLGIIKTHLRYQ